MNLRTACEHMSVPEEEAYIHDQAEQAPKLIQEGWFAAQVAARRLGAISVYIALVFCDGWHALWQCNAVCSTDKIAPCQGREKWLDWLPYFGIVVSLVLFIVYW